MQKIKHKILWADRFRITGKVLQEIKEDTTEHLRIRQRECNEVGDYVMASTISLELQQRHPDRVLLPQTDTTPPPPPKSWTKVPDY